MAKQNIPTSSNKADTVGKRPHELIREKQAAAQKAAAEAQPDRAEKSAAQGRGRR